MDKVLSANLDLGVRALDARDAVAAFESEGEGARILAFGLGDSVERIEQVAG